MRPTPIRILAAAVAALALGGAARAATLPEVLKPLLMPAGTDYSPDWKSVEADKAVRWGQGPVMLNTPSPDGGYFARPGQAIVDGRPFMVVASGARTMVGSYYLRDPGPLRPAETIEAEFRAAGLNLAPVRCAIHPTANETRHWYKLTAAGKDPAFLYVGPLASGGQGYTLYLGGLPQMTRAESMAYTDQCENGRASPNAAAPIPGEIVVAGIIEALMRPAGQPAAIPWTALPSSKAITWQKVVAMKSPYGEGGDDPNTHLASGQLQMNTVQSGLVASGDARAANHFLLREIQNLPKGAVFAALQRDGFTITAVRCGKPYTKMSENWFRISGGGRQPAILYRAFYNDPGWERITYGLRLDGVLPPAMPGQRPAAGGQCPG